MTRAEALLAARKKIEHGWCRWASALDADGNAVFATSEKAVRFCATGAIASVVGLQAPMGELSALEILLDHATEDVTEGGEDEFDNVVDFNDAAETTRDDVLRVYDLAIAGARAMVTP